METKQRQTAFKARISDLLNGKYFVQEGWEPNYVLVGSKKVSRTNVIGVVVSKQSSELGQNEIMVLDDGSGRISVRSFESTGFSQIKVGNVVVLIGRPREYGGEIYIVPEIIRQIEDKKWVEVRKAEFALVKSNGEKNIKNAEIKSEVVEKNDVPESKLKVEEDKSNGASHAEKIIAHIRDMDKGEGVDFEEIVNKYGENNTEKIINGMLERGDLFELKPGKLKVLE